MKINKGIKKVKRFMAISLSVLCLSSCANVSLADGPFCEDNIFSFETLEALSPWLRISDVIGVETARNASFRRLANGEIYKFNENFSQENFRVEIINLLYSIQARIEDPEWDVIRCFSDSRINYMLDNLPNLERGEALIGLISSFVINLLDLVHRHDPAAARKDEILKYVRKIKNIKNKNINFNNIKNILTDMLDSMEQFFADHPRPNAV